MSDFTLPASTRLGSLDIFLSDYQANDNHVVDGFEGVLSWAV